MGDDVASAEESSIYREIVSRCGGGASFLTSATSNYTSNESIDSYFKTFNVKQKHAIDLACS